MSEGRTIGNPAEGVGQHDASVMHVKTRLSHVASAANQPQCSFSQSAEIWLLWVARDMLDIYLVTFPRCPCQYAKLFREICLDECLYHALQVAGR
jgi:hypothetical protein